VGQGVLAAWEREAARVATCAENELLCAQRPPIRKGDRMSICEARIRHVGEEAHAGVCQVAIEPLLLMHLVDDLVRTCEKTGKIHHYGLTLKAIGSVLPRITRQSRGLCQHAGRNATVIRARSAQVTAFDERHISTQLARSQGSRHTGRPSAHNDNIKHIASHSLPS
jgi:hypothetical protein